MKKLSFFLLLIALVSCAFQENKRKKIKSYYPSGKLKAITEMEEGRKNGKEELYFEDGNLFMVQFFKNDMLVDSFYQYNKDKPGEVLFRGYSTMRSRMTTMFANGQVFGENDFKENLVPDGLMVTKNMKGRTASMSIYSDGKLNGVQVFYFLNGNVKKIEHYKDGVKIPPVIEYDSTGKMIKYVPVSD